MEEGFDPEENMDLNLQVQVIPKEQVDEEQLKEFIEFFRAGYDDRWVGEEYFRNVVMKNSTELLTMRKEGKLVAAFNFDHHRITDIAVNPEYRGSGIGVKLFQEAARHDPKSWITIAADAEGMLATVTSQGLNYLPVEDKNQMESLFQEGNGTRDNYQVEVSEVEIPWLAARLQEKGIEHSDTFIASSRNKSLHGPTYWQLLFQNQK
ncbi:MAG: GNAT family N-acetyltransferase [Candidatus Daviesbacteria bacterium]|nr:MAG: GNAT family N-acetyltransferase [Candidatus Daviesbacteria bacterium]